MLFPELDLLSTFSLTFVVINVLFVIVVDDICPPTVKIKAQPNAGGGGGD